MAFLRFTICIASRRYTDNICLQDQVTGLSCSALSRFPQCHKQVCCMPSWESAAGAQSFCLAQEPTGTFEG